MRVGSREFRLGVTSGAKKITPGTMLPNYFIALSSALSRSHVPYSDSWVPPWAGGASTGVASFYLYVPEALPKQRG